MFIVSLQSMPTENLVNVQWKDDICNTQAVFMLLLLYNREIYRKKQNVKKFPSFKPGFQVEIMCDLGPWSNILHRSLQAFTGDRFCSEKFSIDTVCLNPKSWVLFPLQKWILLSFPSFLPKPGEMFSLQRWMMSSNWDYSVILTWIWVAVSPPE